MQCGGYATYDVYHSLGLTIEITYASNQGKLNILNLATSLQYSSVGLTSLIHHGD